MALKLKGRRRAKLAGLLLVAVLVLAPLAIAHESRWRVHSGGGSGQVSNHHWITKCDSDVDGHHVWVRYHTNLMSPADDFATTGYAPSGGCNREGSSPYGAPVGWFQVCIHYEGCTPRSNHNDSSW